MHTGLRANDAAIPETYCELFKVDGHSVRVELVDVPGLLSCGPARDGALRGAHVAVVVWSVANRDSFESAVCMAEQLQAGFEGVVLLVGNMTDRARQVLATEGEVL